MVRASVFGQIPMLKTGQEEIPWLGCSRGQCSNLYTQLGLHWQWFVIKVCSVGPKLDQKAARASCWGLVIFREGMFCCCGDSQTDKGPAERDCRNLRPWNTGSTRAGAWWGAQLTWLAVSGPFCVVLVVVSVAASVGLSRSLEVLASLLFGLT